MIWRGIDKPGAPATGATPSLALRGGKRAEKGDSAHLLSDGSLMYAVPFSFSRRLNFRQSKPRPNAVYPVMGSDQISADEQPNQPGDDKDQDAL